MPVSLAKSWAVFFALACLSALVLFGAVIHLFQTGIGIWGNNVPVGWGWDIVCFVWWIGIAHAGTLISAILVLFRQQWRAAISRFAETMTLFAAGCACLYLLLHMGRPWTAHWLLPIPSTLGLWPQFRSPLVWDVLALSSYLLVSFLFWYLGLIPDLAILRDQEKSKLRKRIYALTALGWRNSARQWAHYQSAYLLLAGLLTPLVISVHSIVGFDFAVSIVPGWHSTIAPLSFVAGALFSGLAMVLTLVIPLRSLFGFREAITIEHLERIAKIMLATGVVVVHGHFVEAIMAVHSGNEFERILFYSRFLGPYSVQVYIMTAAAMVLPQILWFRRLRRNPWALFLIAIVTNIGMWLERFVLVVISLDQKFLPLSRTPYSGTLFDIATFASTLGLFVALMLLFVLIFPVISRCETRGFPQEKEGP